MKKKDNKLNLIQYVGKMIKAKKADLTTKKPKEYQPSWMYRNE